MLFGYIPDRLKEIPIKTDLYIILRPETPVDDGTRVFLTEETQTRFHNLLLEEVSNSKVPNIIIGKDDGSTALQAINTRYVRRT